jgi:hypothetical protein
MTEAAVSFAGNLTDDPEVRSTEGGIIRAVFRVAVSGRREQEPSFFTVVVWRDQAEHASQSLTKGSRVVVVGRLQQRAWIGEDGSADRWWRSWLRSWGRASLVHLGGGTSLECRRTPGAVGSSPPSLAWMKAERSSRGPTVRDASSGNRATRSRAPISEPPATASRYRRCVGPFPLGSASSKDHHGCCHTIPGRWPGWGVAAARGVRAGPDGQVRARFDVPHTGTELRG